MWGLIETREKLVRAPVVVIRTEMTVSVVDSVLVLWSFTVTLTLLAGVFIFTSTEWEDWEDTLPRVPHPKFSVAIWIPIYGLRAAAMCIGWRDGFFPDGSANSIWTAFWVTGILTLLFSVLWTWVFFGLKKPGLALVAGAIAVACCCTNMGLAWTFANVVPAALLIPECVWQVIGFALNAVIVYRLAGGKHRPKYRGLSEY